MQMRELLGASGPFNKALQGFMPRAGQQDLSEVIHQVLHNRGTLVAEAGTGIGKTFAYLVPAMLADKKIIISTGTRHLQDQLFHRDLPAVKAALNLTLDVALLKGRSNYLCLYRVDLDDHQPFYTNEIRDHLQRIRQWSKTTRSGDIGEMHGITEDARVWPMVTSTAENCLGTECPKWTDCFVVKARRAAQEADMVVINHHLLLADMALKENGFGDLLPSADAFIIDEAHQLPDVASRFFGKTISSRQLTNLMSDVVAEQIKDAPECSALRDLADAVKLSAQDFRLALGGDNQRDAWLKIQNQKAIEQGREQLQNAITELAAALEKVTERGKGLEQCHGRCVLLKQLMQNYGKPAPVVEGVATQEFIYWYETSSRGFMLHMTPLDVASLFRSHQQTLKASWIFTSATLQVGNDFEHFSSSLGLDDYQSGHWNSPFDYLQQSLLYLPSGLPEPSSQDFTRKLMELALPVLQASRGRAFILFTSYRALNEAREWLHGKIDYPVLVQGDKPKHQLLQKFKELGNAILLGTSSFWEGVDVRGEALSCVIIDKLPFASPGDPVMQARLDAIKKTGGNPFSDYQIPQAVIALKQGAGRLIRDVTDYGVLMIGDPRLLGKPYGKIFLRSLPEMPQTRNLIDVQNFFAQLDVKA